MRKTLKNLFSYLILPLLCFAMVNAQELDQNTYNSNSVRPIRQADIMYKNTVWLKMDIREKQNEPFFAQNDELSKVIIDAVKNQILRPFKNDSLNTRMSLQEFLENLKVPGADDGDDNAGGDDWDGGGGDEDWGGGWDDSSGTDDGGDNDTEGTEEFWPSQITLFQFKQDILFDKKRSRIYYDIQSVELIIPGELLPTGLDKVLAVFSYKELVENVFTDNPYAVWYNPKNIAENRNFADAFDLRLYSATLVKYANPKDLYVVDIYNNNQRLALAKELEYEHKLLNYEAELWSY